MANKYLKSYIFKQKCLPYFVYGRLKRFGAAMKDAKKEKSFYRYIFAPQILYSKPAVCDPNSHYEIHILTAKSVFLQAMWALKTYYFYAQQAPMLAVHDDGSLSDKEKKIFEEHFKNCRVIMKEEADTRLRPHLDDYLFCRAARFERPDSFMAIKMLDFYYFAEKDHILVLDSDELFFNKPAELLNCIDRKQPFYMDDNMDDHCFPLEFVEKKFNVKPLPHFNSGLVFAPVSVYHLDFIEKVCRQCYIQDNYHLYEQTVCMLNFSKYLPAAKMLSKAYSIDKDPVKESTHMHHFVNNGLREEKYMEGFKLLRKKNFLKLQRSS